MKNRLKLRFAVVMISILTFLSSPIFGGGAKEETVTKIDIAEQDRQYIAPGNDKAIIRKLVVPFKELIVSATDTVVRSWVFNVYNAKGTIIFTKSLFENGERGFFGDLLNIGTKPAVVIPPTLEWDGTFNTPDSTLNGTLVADGNYSYQLSLIDDKGNRAQTPPFAVTVRNSAISIDYVKIPLPIFNPNGKRNLVNIEQFGSRETLWVGSISNEAGKVVRTFTWENTDLVQAHDVRPPDFSWDGKDENGSLLPEGKYFYTVGGKNRPGASASLSSDVPIVLSMKSGSVIIGTSENLISPNNDGFLDSININTHVDDAQGISEWTLAISSVNKPETSVWSRTGRGAIPEKFVFDGVGTDGRTLASGNYKIVMKTTYDNGNVTESLPSIFECDLNTPVVTLTSDLIVFGGEKRPNITFTIGGTASIPLTFEIIDGHEKVIFTKSLENEASYSLVWDGKGTKNNTVADDIYKIAVKGRDKAGNLGAANLQIRKDSRTMEGSVELSQATINQNRAGMNSVRITPILAVLDSIEDMQITIVSAENVIVAQKKSKNVIPFWDWLGKADNGKSLIDGNYDVLLQVGYLNGSMTVAKSELQLDSKIPEIKLSLEPKSIAFSPSLTPISFSLGLTPTLPIKEWKFTIQHKTQAVLYSQSGTGSLPPQIVWDGKTNEKTTVDGLYDAKIVVNFDNGMKSEASAKSPITVSTKGPQFNLLLSSASFVPGNLDGPQNLMIKIDAQKSTISLSKWLVEIRNEQNETVQSFDGKTVLPENIVWDGKLKNGKTVMSGEEYTVSARLTDNIGLESEKKAKVIVDILVVQLPNGSYKIVVNSIQFPGNSSDLFKVKDQLLDKNMFALRRLAVVLNKFPQYRIRLEGYAVSEFYKDAKQAEWEQKTELLPLSKDRADEVMKVLVLLGVDLKRFTVAGFGAERPVVPHNDLENRWQNRRVEFYLEQ